ncbi:MAG: fumarylacetoacetate hydrolase family protein, partial [Chloroflexota bacterium]
MRYYQIAVRGGESHLAVEATEDMVVDLTALSPHVRSFFDLMQTASIMGTTIDRVARQVLDRGTSSTFSVRDMHENTENASGWPRMQVPLRSPEVWATGVTYQDSMKERQAESGTPDVYARVYAADRPEVFFKATPSRLMGPYDEVGIRADSTWDVPEPELGFVLYDGEIVGYLCGNDMSSRSIEGENPLYLPQAKVYDRSCSIGPCIATRETVGDPQDLTVRLAIERGGKQAFQGETSTSLMVKDCEYIADWLQRHNPV